MVKVVLVLAAITFTEGSVKMSPSFSRNQVCFELKYCKLGCDNYRTGYQSGGLVELKTTGLFQLKDGCDNHGKS